MSGPPAPPAPTGVARSQLILAAGCSAAASILAAWLLAWLIFFQTHLRILAFASDAVGAAIPVALAFQHADAKDATTRGAAGELRPLPAANPGELIPAIAAYLDEHRGQTSIVYLASPALGSFGAAPEVVLAPADVFRHVVKDGQLPGATLRELLAAFKQARGRRLLILDIGRSQADCDAGAFGDDVVAELERLARPPERGDAEEYAAWQREWAGFAILCSNAAGQWAWASDVDGRSVFGHYVAEGLRRGGEVGDLLKAVPAQVHRWVAEQRGGAVQTPIVLGDRAVSFHIPIPKDRVADEPDPRQGDLARAIRGRLLRHYERHAAYERGGLPGLDPLAWRDYRQAWLLAERHFRAGQVAAAGRLLARADAQERPFKDPGAHDWPSLELSLAVTTDRDRLDPLLALKGSPGPPPDAPPPAGGGARTFDDFAESQPRRFAQGYDEALKAVGRPPDPGRARLVDQALRVRRLAEAAAAAAPGGHPWIDRLIDEAGPQRRAALDILFSDAGREPIDALLRGAERRYAAALEVAQAVNLSHRVAADLPFLGAWAIRSQEPDRDRLVKIAEQARTLADSLAGGRTDPGEPPVARVKGEADALAREFAALQKRFQDAALAASQSDSWRAVDDVLAVPSIDPALRDKLVGRSVDPALVVALRPPADPKAGEGESAGLGLVRQGLNSGITVRELGRKGYDALGDRSRAAALAGPAPEIRPDPSFAPHQGGLILLEWCLLTIGGLDDAATLRSLLHPPEAPGGIAQVARLARARLMQQALPTPRNGPAAAAARERIRLALPATGLDEGRGDPGSARWNRLVVRGADILRADGDARLAGRYLAGLAERDRGAEGARQVAQGIEALAHPIRLDHRLGGSPVLGSGSPVPLDFVAHAPAGYPPGRSALLLGRGDDLRIDADRPHELIDIGGPAAATARVEVRRRDLLTRGEAHASVRSALFFRGQRADAAAIPFDLPVVQPDLEVHFVTRNLAGHRAEMAKHYHIDGRNIVDQFRGRQDEYFLYRGAETALDAVLRCPPRAGGEHPGPRRVVASASFNGTPLPVTPKDAKDDRAGPVEIKEGQELTFEIGEVDTSDPRSRTPADGSVFRFEVKADGGAGDVLVREEVRFREINPEAYYTATAQRTAPDEVAITVRRGEDDPIAIVTRVMATVGGGQSQLKSIQYEKMSRLSKDVGDRSDGGKGLRREAVSIHGESATFLFRVAPQENLTVKAEVLNTPGRPPWPLAVVPNAIPAAPAPRPHRPARGASPDDPGPDSPGP